MESKKKMLFIFNPFSGKAQIKSKLFEIIDVFVKGGYEVIVHPTQAVGDGFEKTKELAPQVFVIGDAVRARRALDATREAYDAAMSL